MKKLIYLCLFLIPPAAMAQKGSKKKNTPQFFASTISVQDLKKHLYRVASKEMGGRDTPSPGLEMAAGYIEDHFKSLGLMPGNNGSYRQYYPLYKDSMTSTGLKVNGTSYELNKDFQPGTANYTAEMRFSEAVFAGYGIVEDERDDYAGLDVAGKLVVIAEGVPPGYKSSAQGFRSPTSAFGKTAAAQKKGVAALLIVNGSFPRRTFNAVSSWGLNSYRPAQPPFTFMVSESLAASVLGQEAKGFLEKIKTAPPHSKTYKAEIDLSYAKKTISASVSNVLGLIEGTDKKDEYVIITAHYDHVGMRNDTTVFYGADDDGSGTVSVLELAEGFAKAKAAGKGPRRSILFMTVSGEEHGLWGSAYYANHPVFPLDKTTVNLNIDMIGRIGSEYEKDKDSANYVYIIGDDKLSSDLAPITDMVNNNNIKIKLDRKYNDPKDPNRFYYRSDHYNFAEKGVPIIFYFNGTHKDYHRPTDTPDKINYPLMAKRGQLVFYTAWEMANREQMLKRDIKLDVPPRGF
jgi:Zn-dependent M28 family amino/carboxypeptidase